MLTHHESHEESSLYYHPGLYKCFSIKQKNLQSISDNLDMDEWFRHRESAHPTVAYDVPQDEELVWVYDSTGKAGMYGDDFGESASTTERLGIGNTSKEDKEPFYKDTGHKLCIEENGEAWSAKLREKFQGKSYSMSGNEPFYEPSGDWNANLVITDPDANAVEAEVCAQLNAISEANANVDEIQKSLDEAKRQRDQIRNDAGGAITILMNYK